MPARVPLGLGDLTVPVPSHIALFYESEGDLKRRLSFLRPALGDDAEAVVLFGPEPRIDQVLRLIGDELERDVVADVRDGRIIRASGAATTEGTIANVAAALDTAVARGAKLVRLLGFIGWGEEGWPSEDKLLEFEARVNKAVLAYPAVVVCTYGIDRLPASVIVFGGIETHPYTILGTTLCQNPHFVPPEQFIAQRRASSAVVTNRLEQLAKVSIGPLEAAPPPKEKIAR